MMPTRRELASEHAAKIVAEGMRLPRNPRAPGPGVPLIPHCKRETSAGVGSGLPIPRHRTFAAGILPILFGTALAGKHNGLQAVMPQHAPHGSGLPRTISPDVRYGPPGLHSLGSACAPPSMAPLVRYAGSMAGASPRLPPLNRARLIALRPRSSESHWPTRPWLRRRRLPS
jgi:hypothetical protein